MIRAIKAGDIYPLTVIKTRYGGVYEGGPYAAFSSRYYQIPKDALGSDIPCCGWWARNRHLVGIGASMDEAVSDLTNKLQTVDFPKDQFGQTIYVDPDENNEY